MKLTSVIAKYLLGLIFLVFGLNGILHFIPQGPLPPGYAAQFMTVITESHYSAAIFAFQVLGGVLLLVTPYVALGLTVLAPELVNILNFHFTMAPSGLPLAAITTLLWVLAYYNVRGQFAGLLQKS